MAKYKNESQIREHDFSADGIDLKFDSDYFKDEHKGVSSENDMHGADFLANKQKSSTNLPTIPFLSGYIKNGVLHFSIVECRGKGTDRIFLSFGPIYLPTELKFVHVIMYLMHKFGKKYHLAKYAHLKYKIDWKTGYKYFFFDADPLETEPHLNSKNHKAYEEALDEYLPYHSLQKAQAILSRVLGGENKLIHNKSFKHKIEEANSDILSIIYIKKLMKRHYQFQKSQNNDNLKA